MRLDKGRRSPISVVGDKTLCFSTSHLLCLVGGETAVAHPPGSTSGLRTEAKLYQATHHLL